MSFHQRSINMLGIITALPIEARSFSKQSLKPGDVISLSDNCLLAISGMGFERAQKASEVLITRGATQLLSWGTAGGLAPNLQAGDVVVPEKILFKDKEYFADKDWHKEFKQEFNTGSIVFSENILTSVHDKQDLFSKYHAVAIDMESAAVAEIAQKHGLPFLALRFIVDASNEVLPSVVLDALSDDGQVNHVRLLKNLLLKPKEIFALIHLAKSFSKAQKSMNHHSVILRDHSVILRESGGPSVPAGSSAFAEDDERGVDDESK